MKKFISMVLALVMALSLTTVAWGANTITVGATGCDYTTLADAVANAQDGDTISIAAGTYAGIGAPAAADYSRLKSITIIGAGVDATIIEGGFYWGYDHSQTVDKTVTVKGITFKGAGLTVADIANVVIDGNKFVNISGNAAIAVLDQEYNSMNGSAVITNNVIDGVAGTGVGIEVRNGYDVTITGNTVKNTGHNSIQLTKNSAVAQNAGTVDVTGNTLETWGVSGEGRAMRVNLGADAGTTAKDVTIEGNAMTHTAAPEEFVKMTGTDTNDAASLSNNYWNGVAPTAAMVDADNAVVATYYTTAVGGALGGLTGVASTPASAVKGAYLTANMDTLSVYPGLDLDTYTYSLEHYTSGNAAAKTFDQKALWSTHKVTGAKVIEAVFVVAASAESADYAFVNGNQITYLSDVAAYTGTVTALPTVDAKDAAKCGDMFVGGDYAAYTDANAKMYVEKAGGTVYNVGGKYVELVQVTPNTTYIVDTLLANPAGYAPYTLYIVSHEYGVDYKTVATKTEVTNVYCKECKATFAFVEGTKADAVKKFGAGNYIDFGAGLFVAKVANGAAVTPDTDKTVTSAETFDAGIALYVGMSVMAAAGSAVVIGKKKD